MAGGDIRVFAQSLEEDAATRAKSFQAMADRVHAAIESIARMPQPVIARVQGAVAGFGLSLMNACDLVFAADDAYFASAYLTLGVTPDGGGTYSLPRIVGARKAAEIMLLGERLFAPQALALGLVNRVLPVADLDAAVAAAAGKLAKGPQRAVRGVKRLLRGSSARHALRAARAGGGELRRLRRHRRFRRGRARVPRQAPALVRRRHAVTRTLAGRTLLVTGASRGIGLAIALRAARDGANVAILGKTQTPHPKLPGTIHEAARLAEAAGGKALAIACDVRDEDAVARAVAETVARFGGLDLLVNNASAISLTGTLATPVKRFDLMMGVNVRGTFVASQACLPHLLESARAGREPHILTLAPPPTLDPTWFRDHGAYTIAKMGMSLATLGMAEEFRAQGVRVNALWPRSVIATSAVAMIPGAAAAQARMRTPGDRRGRGARDPGRRARRGHRTLPDRRGRAAGSGPACATPATSIATRSTRPSRCCRTCSSTEGPPQAKR